ncbi:MAG TPA: hypothetical protein VI636_19585 [Candidatus Angelobacter sp.]
MVFLPEPTREARKAPEEGIKLKVNADKSAVARPGKRKFLGFSLNHGREPKRHIAAKGLAAV